MEENYINIFCRFLADLVESQSIGRNDLLYILNEFKSICEKLHSRQDLIDFLKKHTGKYHQLEQLQKQLENKNFKFEKYGNI